MSQVTKHRISHPSGPQAGADGRPAAGDAKPRLSPSARTQIGSRLKAIYGCNPAPLPDSIRNLLARIDCCLQRGK